MPNGPEKSVFDFTYNPIEEEAHLTYNAFSDSRPDERASFWFNGPYCEVRRSAHEHVILKIRHSIVQQALRKARTVYVKEVGNDNVVWNYCMTYQEPA